MPARYVIVGASLAGVAAAEAIREHDADGEIVLLGDEPHAPYDRPPLSKELLQGTRGPDDVPLRDDDWAERHRVDVRPATRAVALDTGLRTVHTDGGDRLGYDRLLIATGAQPRRLPALDGLDGVHVLRTLDDAIAVRTAIERGDRIAVVGGGFIGLEVAASARRAGCAVTVVELDDTCLGRAVGPHVGRIVQDLHRHEGVDILTGTGIVGPVVNGGTLVGLELDDGRTLDVDTVVVGIGVSPAASWIGDPAVAVDDGVLVDATLRSSADDVFAAGDVARVTTGDDTRRVEHWTTAVEHGRLAGRNMVVATDERDELDEVPSFWSDQYDAKIRAAGTIDDPIHVQVVEHSADPLKLVALATDGQDVLTGIITIGRASALAKCRPLLGRPGSATACRALIAG